jgi:Na+(H+)/acetate symporter ActP
LTFAFAISCFCIGGLFIEGSLIALNAVANQKSVLGQTGYERQDATSGNTEEESTSEYLWNQLFFSESNFLSIAYQVVPFFSNLSIVIWALVFPGALSTILMVAAGFCFLFPNLVNRLVVDSCMACLYI